MSGSLESDAGEVLIEGFDDRWTIDDTECKECSRYGGRCG